MVRIVLSPAVYARKYQQSVLLSVGIMDDVPLCLACGNDVRPRQEAIQCDACERWQHRTCGTGITRRDYLAACKEGIIAYTCVWCADPTQDVLTKLTGET